MTPGEVLAGYRLLALLGEGGEGQVFLAESTDGLGKQVALKRFAPGSRESFLRELEAYRQVEALRRGSGAQLLAEGLAAGELPDGGGYLVLAWQPGGTLSDRVRAQGPLPAPEAVRLTCELLRGLEVLHAAGLCHRDVKPGNVLLTAEGGVRLGDFGLVRGRESTISSGGTPAFAAPEQLTIDDRPGVQANPREGVPIDVYGAGATLHYLLTGRSPLPGRADLFLLESRDVPRGLQRELLRALQADPRARHPDAASLARALLDALPRAASSEAPAVDARARGADGAAVGAGSGGASWLAAGALLLALGIGWAATRGPALPGPSPPSRVERPPVEAERPVATTPASGAADPAPVATLVADPAGEPPASEPAPPDPEPPPPSPKSSPLDWEPRPPAPAAPNATAQVAPDDPCTLLLDCGGQTSRVPLGGVALLILPVSARSVAVGTDAGEVLLVRTGEPPLSLHRFGSEVLRLSLQGGQLVAEGDDRRPRPLGEGEAARPDEREVEGALGRWAFPRQALPARVVLPLER